MRIDVEEIRKIDERRRQINALNIYDIEWYENGVRLNYTKEQLDEWKYIGLCNTSFVEFCHDHPTQLTVSAKPRRIHSCDIPGCAVCDNTDGL